MSLLIKGMDMPAVGAYEFTLFCFPDGTACAKGFFIKFKGEPFEVIEVPTPHGPLIDGQALYDRTAEWEAEALDQLQELDPQAEKQGRGWKFWNTVLVERVGFKHDVMDAPVIIGAEEGSVDDDPSHPFADDVMMGGAEV